MRQVIIDQELQDLANTKNKYALQKECDASYCLDNMACDDVVGT